MLSGRVQVTGLLAVNPSENRWYSCSVSKTVQVLRPRFAEKLFLKRNRLGVQVIKESRMDVICARNL